MEQTESQIAKIQIFSPKTASNYIHTTAEKAAASDSELYLVAELPLLNPAALEGCQQICLAVSSSLKRTYKRPLTDESFENAISQINEELAKLASMGQTYWVDKFNCVLAVKNGEHFHIASCGKVSAYLLRNGEFTDISCSTQKTHPLKTFENFATGKLKLGDLVILSNTKLLNYISIDRLKEILTKNNFLTASQTIIELLKENAGPEVAFGTILNLQVPYGKQHSDEIDLENYIVDNSSGRFNLQNVTSFLKSLLGAASAKRPAKTELPKTLSSNLDSKDIKKIPSLEEMVKISSPKNSISFLNKFSSAKDFLSHGLELTKKFFKNLPKILSGAGKSFSKENISQLSGPKKFFFIAAGFLILAFILNLGITVYLKNNRKTKTEVVNKLSEINIALNNTESLLLYRDEKKARESFEIAQSSLPNMEEIPEEQQQEYKNITARMDGLKKQIERTVELEAQELGGLADAERLINLPEYIAVQAGNSIVSYNKQTGSIEDGKLKNTSPIIAALAIKPGITTVYNGEYLAVWDYSSGTVGQTLISSVPAKENFVGLAYYPTNNRVYVIDKQKKQVINFLVNVNRLQNPVVAISETTDLGNAIGIAIDGSIYVLNTNGISKYQAGKLAQFEMPFLFKPFSGQGKIYTEINWQNIYLLDQGNNRILVLDKSGELVNTIISQDFTNLKDFIVDEANKTIHVLNGSSLLKVNF